ncbi:MAG: YebC/PmpR family DNA-binding transcriptional regulator [Candidatus Aminicenantes bacterium]|nr:YebC/PmpR family DNA-binding transcriptional regulator [Candidatus Aminicenantes bacterium]
MSGHSKWHSIRHKKAIVDAKRGKMFSKMIREITVAARTGGGDPDANPRLRTAIQTAKAANMPHDNIERAVMKGTGELPGQNFDSVTYEGYGPGGVAVLIETLTDNRNRTVAEIRHIFSKNGGSLGETGSVLWMFEKRGYIGVPSASVSEETLLEVVLDAGADDLQTEGDTLAVYTPFENFEQVRQELEASNIPTESSQITMLPQNSLRMEGKMAGKMLKLMDALEDHDDVQHVYANFDIDEQEMEALLQT